MKCVEILPSVDDLMDRQKLVGWIVRDQILTQGITYTEASKRWPISLPTLNRLMNTGNVGVRFLRTAAINLGLPANLLELVIDGDVEAIKALDLESPLREYILREMGDAAEPRKKRQA